MTHLANKTKISKFLEKTILSRLNDLCEHLIEGRLSRYEELLSGLLQSAFNYISDLFVPEIANQLQAVLVAKGRELGGRKMELRPLSISLSSGHQIKVQGPYVRQLPKEKPWPGSRHMLAQHWHIIGGASPGLYSKVGYCSALGPAARSIAIASPYRWSSFATATTYQKRPLLEVQSSSRGVLSKNMAGSHAKSSAWVKASFNFFLETKASRIL